MAFLLAFTIFLLGSISFKEYSAGLYNAFYYGNIKDVIFYSMLFFVYFCSFFYILS